MFKNFFNQHKKGCLITAGILGSILFALYLYVLFLPGMWHWDAFLFKQKDGSFSGTGKYASYEVDVVRTDNNATITFAVNDTIREYQITGITTKNNISIYQDGERVFHGQVISAGDSDYWLMGEEDTMQNEILVLTNHDEPDEAQLFPSKNWLYACAINDIGIFGNPYMLIPILLLAVALALDIKFPKMFFYLRHSYMIDGGEPSEWYYTSQMIGRVIIVILIPVCMWMSLFS